MARDSKGENRVLVQARLQSDVADDLRAETSVEYPGKSMAAPFVADAMALYFENPNGVKDFHNIGVLPTSRPLYNALLNEARRQGIPLNDFVTGVLTDVLSEVFGVEVEEASAGQQEVLKISA